MKILSKKIIVVSLLNVIFYFSLGPGNAYIVYSLSDSLIIFSFLKYFDYLKFWKEVMHVGIIKALNLIIFFSFESVYIFFLTLVFLILYTVYDFFYTHNFFKA